MASGDDLTQILDHARHALPDAPDEIWTKLEEIIRGEFGATRVYIAARKKKSHLRALESMSGQDDVAALASMLKLSVRRVQQLQQLKKRK